MKTLAFQSNILLLLSILFICSYCSAKDTPDPSGGNGEKDVFKSNAVVSVNNNLQSKMVLQQNSALTIKGTGTANEKIRITCDWESENTYHTVEIPSNGNWSLTINTPAGSFESRKITVEGKNKIIFSDILIGEVWLCSGQSNMAWKVKDALNGPAEVYNADSYPNIRLLQMAKIQSDTPTDNFSAVWQVCSRTTIPDFSAVAFFFGRKLLDELNVPIGLINASWGDTTAEVWTEQEAIEKSSNEAVKEGASRNNKTPRVTPTTPYKIGTAYNAMIYPLRDIPIAGAIWYQGESNQNYPYYYAELLNILVQSWRKLWSATETNFPFYISQICPYNRKHNFPTHYSNSAMRFVQWKASELIPNSGIECNDDIGELTDIHPKNKQDVGLRLAWLALFKTYGKTEFSKKITASYESHLVEDDKIIITFKNVGNGLKTTDGSDPTMFEIAGEDKVFHSAKASISDKNKIILSNSKVSKPVAARLGWSYVKTTNLINSEALPVCVFKTYEWEDDKEEETNQ